MDTSMLIRILDKNEFDRYIRNKNSIIIQSSWNEPNNQSTSIWGCNIYIRSGTYAVTNILVNLMQNNTGTSCNQRAFIDGNYDGENSLAYFQARIAHGNMVGNSVPTWCNSSSTYNTYNIWVSTNDNIGGVGGTWYISTYNSFRPVFEYEDANIDGNLFY